MRLGTNSWSADENDYVNSACREKRKLILSFGDITLANGLFQKKNQTGSAEDILFWKAAWDFWIFYFTPGNSKQSKALPLETPQNCVTPLGNFQA